MEKILAIHKPYVSHTPESSFLFSILQDIPTSDEWICSRLLSMVVRKPNVHDEFSMVGNFFSECPFFHIVNMKDEIIRKILALSFSDCIERAVNGGYYVSAMVNTRYINNYYLAKDSQHHLHIFGYNTDKQTVCIADHFKKGYFTFEECSFSEINLSRTNIDSDIAFVKLLPDVRYSMTFEMIISLLSEHLNSDNIFLKYKVHNSAYPEDQENNCYFGLKYYDCLIEVLNGGRFPYNRPIILICEHIKVLKMLLTIIHRKVTPNIVKVFSAYDDLQKQAELLKYYYMKVQIINHFNESEFNEIHNIEQIDKVTELLLIVKDKERLLLENTIKILINQ